MSKFSHTPGPYRLGSGLPSSRTIETTPDEKGRTRTIANMRTAGLSDEEVRANACLLSASARMHAVLWAIHGNKEVGALLNDMAMPDDPDLSVWKALHFAVIEAATGVPMNVEKAR